MTARAIPSPVPILRLSERERAGLEWLRTRAGYWLVALRRRRKRLPPGPYSPEEVEVLKALCDLEHTVSRLLELGK